MSRYVGTGSGDWRGGEYAYTPSVEDRLLAMRLGLAVAARVTKARRKHTGYGDEYEARPEWYSTGVLGEIAALHPIGSGPDLDAWEGRRWYGKGDAGPLEIRTTSTFQLYGFVYKATSRGRGRKPAHRHAWRTISEADDGRIVEGCGVDRCVETRIVGRDGRPVHAKPEREPERLAPAGVQGDGLAGWRVTAKDRGRLIVCVEDRGDDFVVRGWAYADDVPRLPKPLDYIIAVVDYLDLRALDELEPYAAAIAR